MCYLSEKYLSSLSLRLLYLISHSACVINYIDFLLRGLQWF